MTSLLAFAWRKTKSSSNGASSSIHSPLDADQPDLHPGVSSSSSGETLSNPISSDSLFAKDSRKSSCIAGPETPDALRGRRSPEEIREELGLPPKKLNWEQEDPPNSSMDSVCASPACALLPPMFGGCGSLCSPQVSTSSFYSRTSRSIQNVAESPNLKIGHAKTAVGALLALNDSRAKNPPMSPPHSTLRLRKESSILPSRAWLQDDRSVDEAEDLSIDMPYESLNDSRRCFSPKSYGLDDGSISEDESSIHASPSSNRHQGLPRNLPNTSFTKGFLQADTSRLSEDDRYDFHPIVDKELIVSDETNPLLNMSCMSQSTAKESDSLCSMGGEIGPMEMKATSEEAMFQSQNERCIKEDLLLSTLERLQDDNEIVIEVMDAIKEVRGDWNFSISPEEDNLFSGFSNSSRSQILDNLDAQKSKLCSERDVDQELVDALSFCRSLVYAAIPTSEKIAGAQCSSNTPYFPQHTHRWRHIRGLRAALGFDDIPQSPQTVRGGDTSLFSLPSESVNDATPHTSNVSMTSTITTAVSPDTRANRRSNHFLQRGNLRRTIELLCLSYDELGTECSKMAEKQGATFEAVQAIRNIYRQLLSLPNDDLKALIDSFELDILNIARLVSHDQGDEYEEMETASSLAQAFPLVRSWAPSTDQQPGPQMTALSLEPIDIHLVEEEEEEEEHEERENLEIFSPTTQDMQSIETSRIGSPDTIDDDLRRTVGSFDREEDEREYRDAPPAVNNNEQATCNKWGKGRLGIFNRRNFRRRQAAE